MLLNYMRTCRLCGNTAWEDDLLKYGTRAYAHYGCFVKFKKLSDIKLLSERQQKLLKEWVG